MLTCRMRHTAVTFLVHLKGRDERNQSWVLDLMKLFADHSLRIRPRHCRTQATLSERDLRRSTFEIFCANLAESRAYRRTGMVLRPEVARVGLCCLGRRVAVERREAAAATAGVAGMSNDFCACRGRCLEARSGCGSRGLRR